MPKSLFYVVAIALLVCGCSNTIVNSKTVVNAELKRKATKPNATFFIDPKSGNDANNGTSKTSPWKTFKPLNALELTAGNTVEILQAGDFRESLFIVGKGTSSAPITINFAPGTYNFYPEHFEKQKLQISNTNDDPEGLKAIAIYVLNSEHVTITGKDANIVLRGKAIYTCMQQSKHVNIAQLTFDYFTPTVSEFKIISATDTYAVAEVHKDSHFEIKDSTLFWQGEGWAYKVQNLFQIFNPETQRVRRQNINVNTLRFEKKSATSFIIHYTENTLFQPGLVFQCRNIFRDYAGVFIDTCKDVSWQNVNFNFIHGMGIVCQLTENITFNNLAVRPNKNSGRTCAAWADILHFSNCKGVINVTNSFLSAANDDALNVHGIHMRIIKQIDPNTILVCFMHPQSNGFNMFMPNDEITFIRGNSLLPFGENRVKSSKLINQTDIELSLNNPIPEALNPNDVVENKTFTPDLNFKNNTIIHIPTRGILITTQGKVVVENNTFDKVNETAILISDDANNWYESGLVKDVSIINNTFIEGGSPVIDIRPENADNIKENYVHSNISITNNTFNITGGQVLFAKSTNNLTFSSNTINGPSDSTIQQLLNFTYCGSINLNRNQINPLP